MNLDNPFGHFNDRHNRHGHQRPPFARRRKRTRGRARSAELPYGKSTTQQLATTIRCRGEQKHSDSTFVEPRLGGQSRHVPSSTVIHAFNNGRPNARHVQWPSPRNPKFRAPRATTTAHDGLHSALHSLRGPPVHAVFCHRALRLGYASTTSHSQQVFSIFLRTFHSDFPSSFTGILPSPSIGSASPAPPVTDLIPGHDFAALNQEASAQNHPSKRFQQAISQVQHLLERGNIPELYVAIHGRSGNLLTP